MGKIVLLILAIVIVIPALGYSKTIGTHGAVYSIAETDAYEELMAKVKKINWGEIIQKYKTTLDNTIKANFNLKKADKDNTLVVNPTYTLQFDITDEKGNIIYPKGYQFNPLDYINFPYKVVFFNAESKTELEWLKSQPWFSDYNTILIITKGDAIKTQEKLGRVVFAANKRMIDKFGISKTPSILEAKNKQILIFEKGIYKKDHEKK